jgi:hypothetical protein
VANRFHHADEPGGRVHSRDVGDVNRRLVLEALRARRVVSRIGLARETGLSKATITLIVEQLIREGFAREIGPGEAGLGRRPTLLAGTSAAARLDGPLKALDLEAVERLVAAGCAAALETVDEAAAYLGLAAANLVDILNPEVLVLGGTVIRALPSIVPRVEAVVRRRALPAVTRPLRVVPSVLGRDAVPVGAAVFLMGQVPIVGPPSARAAPAGVRRAML